MAKDNIEYNSFIAQALNFDSEIINAIDSNSHISNDLNFESPIGIEDEPAGIGVMIIESTFIIA